MLKHFNFLLDGAALMIILHEALVMFLYCCAHAYLEPCLIAISSSCNAVVARICREKEKEKSTNCLGHQIYREVGANVIIATLCIFFLMCSSV